MLKKSAKDKEPGVLSVCVSEAGRLKKQFGGKNNNDGEWEQAVQTHMALAWPLLPPLISLTCM